jgi:hypothetical protein
MTTSARIGELGEAFIAVKRERNTPCLAELASAWPQSKRKTSQAVRDASRLKVHLLCGKANQRPAATYGTS